MKPSKSGEESAPEIQDVRASWKGIADYFGCNVRTAKRWERDRGLPVYRAPGKKGGTVFAYTLELDHWLRAKNQPEATDSAPSGHNSGSVQGGIPADVSEAQAISNAPFVSKERFSNHRSWIASGTAIAVIFIVGLAALRTTRDRLSVSAESTSTARAIHASRHVPTPGAEELYFSGRYFWELRTADGLSKALDAYTQAIVEDPSYAEAYAGLAETYDLLPQFGHADLDDSLARAIEAADRAIALDPDLATAHASKAFALFYLRWDIAGSDAEFRRALVLDPNSALIHQWYASTLEDRLEGVECLKQIEAALRLDPTSASIAADAALFQANFGDFGAGVKALKEIEQTQPTLASPAYFLRELDFATGDYAGYVAESRHYASITRARDDIALADAVARGWAQGGRTGMFQARARVLKAIFDRGGNSGYQLGQTLLLLGQPQKALPYFRAALDRHSLLLMTMAQCPWAKALAHDPGYAALFAQIQEHLSKGYVAHPGVVPVKLRLPR